MNRKLLIVNADDLGFSPAITEGILQVHRRGIVTSATLAANMPAAADAVARLADYPELGVGVHLNASQGPPLSRRGREVLAGANGTMDRTAMGVILAAATRPGALAAIAEEFDAQIRWVLDQGLRPTHLDSHRHAHGFGLIFLRVAALARRYRIPFVRWYGPAPRGVHPRGPARQRRIAKVLSAFGRINALLAGELRATRATWGVEHTGQIDAAWLVRSMVAVPDDGRAVEIMVHPGRAGDAGPAATRLTESREKELAALCDPSVREAVERNGIELTHYGRIADTRRGRRP